MYIQITKKNFILGLILLVALFGGFYLLIQQLQKPQENRQRATEQTQGYAPDAACSTKTFTDLSSSTAQNLSTAVSCLNQSLYKYCVVKGFEDGTLHPNDNLSRAEYVAFIVRYHNYVKNEWTLMTKAEIDALPAWSSSLDPTVKQFKFSDVPSDYPLAPEIYTSQKNGFILGDGAGHFSPEQTWAYGFHGIYRNDQDAVSQAHPEDSFNGKYDFTKLSDPITRGEFISELYQYGTDPSKLFNNHLQLAACLQPGVTPTGGVCNNTQATCTWDSTPGATSYQVSIVDNATGSTVATGTVNSSSAKSYTFAMTPGNSYTCKVAAVNGCGVGPQGQGVGTCTAATPTPTVPVPTVTPIPPTTTPTPTPTKAPTPTMTPSPTNTPVPTASPTPSPTPTFTPTPTPRPTNTPAPTPTLAIPTATPTPVLIVQAPLATPTLAIPTPTPVTRVVTIAPTGSTTIPTILGAAGVLLGTVGALVFFLF